LPQNGSLNALKVQKMAESQREKKMRAVATYTSLERALYSLSGTLDRQCENLGLSPSQFRVLEYLQRYGAMPTGDLAAGVMFGDSTISVVVKNLESEGLVERRAHETDGRKSVVDLTSEGKELIERILPKRAKVLRAQMCVLGKREQENLERICLKLAKGDAVKFILEMTMIDNEDEEE
jgi:MarR family transcriptional regulator, 2-MHQ and catechol-resistance regulon repressor